jgi:hypothetical protein
MVNSHSLQSIFAQATEREKEYDWVCAISFCEKALARELKEKKFGAASEIQKNDGQRLCLVAFQAGRVAGSIFCQRAGCCLAVDIDLSRARPAPNRVQV